MRTHLLHINEVITDFNFGDKNYSIYDPDNLLKKDYLFAYSVDTTKHKICIRTGLIKLYPVLRESFLRERSLIKEKVNRSGIYFLTHYRMVGKREYIARKDKDISRGDLYVFLLGEAKEEVVSNPNTPIL